MYVPAVRWSSKPTGRSAFHLARGRGTLFIADAHYFCLDKVTPGARLVQVDQHLPTIVVAYAGHVRRVALQGRNPGASRDGRQKAVGESADSLTWKTPEQILVQPLNACPQSLFILELTSRQHERGQDGMGLKRAI